MPKPGEQALTILHSGCSFEHLAVGAHELDLIFGLFPDSSHLLHRVPALHITKVLPIAPDVTCRPPTFLRFLTYQQITGQRSSLRGQPWWRANSFLGAVVQRCRCCQLPVNR